MFFTTLRLNVFQWIDEPELFLWLLYNRSQHLVLQAEAPPVELLLSWACLKVYGTFLENVHVFVAHLSKRSRLSSGWWILKTQRPPEPWWPSSCPWACPSGLLCPSPSEVSSDPHFTISPFLSFHVLMRSSKPQLKMTEFPFKSQEVVTVIDFLLLTRETVVLSEVGLYKSLSWGFKDV